MSVQASMEASPLPVWAKVIDQTRCIGCHACTTACKSENEVPVSVTRTYVKYVDVGMFPQVRRAFQVTRCNQCVDAPCVTACPTASMHRRPDGIVDFDKGVCIGCKACIAACPYDAIFINPDDHSAEKCNFCAHRIDVGLEPACVVVCPTEAIIVGDLRDTGSRVAQTVHRAPVNVRRPEKGTQPKLFYKGAHEATLDPLAARRPEGGLFLWSEQPQRAGAVPSGHAHQPTNAAAAVLAYDVRHSAPWDWRVSAYTWTKGIASGVYLVALGLLVFGAVTSASALWTVATPLLGAVALALTGALLIWDLEHPERFYMIFTRPQWKSWLVRGGVLIGAYGLFLAAHLVAGFASRGDLTVHLGWIGAPLAAATAIYTAYLFAQARARDLWQSPLLAPHLLVQSALGGAAVLAFAAISLAPEAVPALLVIVSVSALAHLAFVGGEVTVTHPTAHARVAAGEMLRGRYRWWFSSGVLLVGLSVFAPFLGPAAAVFALLGLFAHEHAYVQAGQSVPLA